jgi:hypothetical protein
VAATVLLYLGAPKKLQGLAALAVGSSSNSASWNRWLSATKPSSPRSTPDCRRLTPSYSSRRAAKRPTLCTPGASCPGS